MEERTTGILICNGWPQLNEDRQLWINRRHYGDRSRDVEIVTFFEASVDRQDAWRQTLRTLDFLLCRDLWTFQRGNSKACTRGLEKRYRLFGAFRWCELKY